MNLSLHQHVNPRRSLYVNAFMMLAVLAAPLGAQSPLPVYSPQQAQYRLISTSHVSQVMMGQTQESETKASQLISVVIAKDGANMSLTMTLDSVSQSSSGPAPLPDASEALGLTFKGVMAPDGHVASSTVTDTSGNPSTLPVASNLRSFLPRLKSGATVGATWADTSNSTRPQGGGTVTTMVATTYTLAGDTTIAGGKHWKINTSAVGTVSGNGQQNGADFTIKGDITGTGTLVVGAGGALIGADSSNDIKLTIDVPMANMQIPITQKESRTITRVK